MPIRNPSAFCNPRLIRLLRSATNAPSTIRPYSAFCDPQRTSPLRSETDPPSTIRHRRSQTDPPSATRRSVCFRAPQTLRANRILVRLANRSVRSSSLLATGHRPLPHSPQLQLRTAQPPSPRCSACARVAAGHQGKLTLRNASVCSDVNHQIIIITCK